MKGKKTADNTDHDSRSRSRVQFFVSNGTTVGCCDSDICAIDGIEMHCLNSCHSIMAYNTIVVTKSNVVQLESLLLVTRLLIVKPQPKSTALSRYGMDMENSV